MISSDFHQVLYDSWYLFLLFMAATLVQISDEHIFCSLFLQADRHAPVPLVSSEKKMLFSEVTLDLVGRL